jgi:hypothetical protein
MDGCPYEWIVKDAADENYHLAKVGVAGSNPVFRSKPGLPRSGPPQWP